MAASWLAIRNDEELSICGSGAEAGAEDKRLSYAAVPGDLLLPALLS